ESFRELVADSDAVGLPLVVKDRCGVRLERIFGELCYHAPLEWVDEADAENVIPHLGDLRVGGGGGDHGNLRLLADASAREAAGAGHFAENGNDLLLDQPLYGNLGLLAVAFRVFRADDLHLLAVNSAALIDLVDREHD